MEELRKAAVPSSCHEPGGRDAQGQQNPLLPAARSSQGLVLAAGRRLLRAHHRVTRALCPVSRAPRWLRVCSPHSSPAPDSSRATDPHRN